VQAATFYPFDITVFDLVTFNESWGRWGIGVDALLPTGGDSRGADQWAAGPAVGFVASPSRAVIFGVFNQNLFRFAGDQDLGQADIDISTIQPIFNYNFGGGWSAGFSEMQIAYDWNEGKFTSLPLGIDLETAQIRRPAGQVQRAVRARFLRRRPDRERYGARLGQVPVRDTVGEQRVTGVRHLRRAHQRDSVERR